MAGSPCDLGRRFEIVDAASGRRVGARRQKDIDDRLVALGRRGVQRRVVVEPALIGIGSGLEQQSDHLHSIISGGCDHGVQRRKPIWFLMVGIGTESEERLDRSEWCNVDGPHQQRYRNHRILHVRERQSIVEDRANLIEVTRAERPLEQEVTRPPVGADRFEAFVRMSSLAASHTTSVAPTRCW